MQKYEWRGTSAIHTPDGVVEHGGSFSADEKWLAGYPQRDWLRRGLIVPFVERQKKSSRGK